MPYTVKYKPLRNSTKDWAIINNDTGKVVGRSDTKAKAESSARARLAGAHGWKGRK